jgi:hypothetical protein
MFVPDYLQKKYDNVRHALSVLDHVPDVAKELSWIHTVESSQLVNSVHSSQVAAFESRF